MTRETPQLEITRRDGIKWMGAMVLPPLIRVDQSHIILTGDTDTDPLTDGSINLSAS